MNSDDLVPLRWLDDETPGTLPNGTTWGFPLTRGRVRDISSLRLRRLPDSNEPAQFWPLATWPDGSLKWVGAALGARGSDPGEYAVVVGAEARAPRPGDAAVRVDVENEVIAVDTGPMRLEFPALRDGEVSPVLFHRLLRDGRIVAERARLISLLQHEIVEEDGRSERHSYTSEVHTVHVEQSGPVRAVIRVEGVHRAEDGDRTWLPFAVRFVAMAGSGSVRMVHSFIWDGDASQDFLAGLGLRIDAPQSSALHDRHVRFSGADDGFFAEAVRGITGLRRDPGAEVRAAQIAGHATPPLEDWDPAVSGRLALIPSWADFSLAQLSADGFTIRKRTKPGHSWIDAAAGARSEGFVSLSSPDGGLGIGMRSFWESHPAQLDIRDAASDRAQLTAWLYSPQAPPMDMRFYHDGLGQDDYAAQLEALEITYEDYEPGYGDARGIARTHELTLFAYATTPSPTEISSGVHDVQRPALLQPTPQYLRSVGVFGDWDLIDRSTPARAEIEGSLDFLTRFYLDQVDQRSWYGFWNYGDVMHAYDSDRHVWRYDVGGYAWDNSELSPDLWLWYSYLRSGRADIFRFAEAMTRHTGEVDVYHLGRWKGLGSRHNVQHWGCSAKQLRISTPAYRRFFHYLTADERVGDLLTELRDSDTRFLDTDPTRKVRPDAATYRPARNALAIGLGTDWGSLAATWLCDWERTGNERSRDRLLGTMADIAALPNGFLTGEALYDIDTGRLDSRRDQIAVSHLSAVFGLAEICSELITLVDMPGFRDAWLQYCRLYLATPDEQQRAVGRPLTGIHLEQAHSRLAAYAAAATQDAKLADDAWRAFDGTGEWLVHRRDLRLIRITPPQSLHPVDEVPTVSTNDAAQYGLAAIQNLALIGDRLDRA
ncbi:Tat pathway signal sequence domain protein [Microbacterium aurantiacum]|uniref:exo-rhamnogalacturonan lyase family protein n=1 Tax=Microbacterium aurantiacum TaxID=162393 RepID=UPI001FE5F5ED|nr:Tat pathway signal sequence domain protein [Microbacterium aurantiacum]